MNEIVTSIIFTHQARIRCLISLLNSDINKKVHRFKNGAVLKVTVKKNSLEQKKWNVTINQVYNGELDGDSEDNDSESESKNDQIGGKKKKYYVLNPTLETETKLGEIEGELSGADINDNKTYEFYIVRHGEATHNIRKGLKKRVGQIYKQDSDLTVNGIKQAYNTGKFLKSLIKEDTTLFASDLKRTHQTLYYALHGAEQGSKTVYILPCSHELNHQKDGRCDGGEGFTPSENVSTTFPKDCADITKQEKEDCISIKNFFMDLPRHSRLTLQNNGFGYYKIQNLELTIDWSFYNSFYSHMPSGKRGKRLIGKKDRPGCRTTNFINQAIEMIETNKELKNKKTETRPQNSFLGVPMTNPRETISVGGKKIKKRRNNKKTKRQHKKHNKKTNRRVKKGRKTKRYINKGKKSKRR